MQFNKYSDTGVELLWSTPNAAEQVSRAIKITMKKDFMQGKPMSAKVFKSILAMGHTSIFEHVVFSFLIAGASRSFLAQITRHRIASYTSGSQHYQVYSDYGSRGHDGIVDNPIYQQAIESSMDAYNALIADGEAPYEARQVLPNAMENNLIFTLNARSLVNFLALRMCRRNTAEIKDVAEKIHAIAAAEFPELFENVGPPCELIRDTALLCYPELLKSGAENAPAWAFCNQGHLSACKKHPWQRKVSGE